MAFRAMGNRTLSRSEAGCAAGVCTRADRSTLPEAIRERIQDHPCFSEEAHHDYARIHLAVAPACNIQCHYCNRKYDCANESRPGVVSELLTPEQAVKKALAVGAVIPQLSVVGIAGPGDPLASPQRTLTTLRGIAQHAPDLRLCLSTNGLRLPEYAEELVKLGVAHVTITINAVDSGIAARIHPWVFWNNRRLGGELGTRVLIEQQQEGLRRLVRRGVLVKVNSVLIPGINDRHLQEVNRVIRAEGAFVHNILPLIVQPEHGTFYGLTGQRGPTAAELKALQDACGTDMNIMRHCRQCRADAVGLLGEDRGGEFTMEVVDAMEVDYRAASRKRVALRNLIEHSRANRRQAQRDAPLLPRLAGVPRDKGRNFLRPLLLAVATEGFGLVNRHFGAATEFLVYEAATTGVRLVGVRNTERYCTGPENCNDASQALESTVRALEGCSAVLCSKIGYEPWLALEAAGIQPNAQYVDVPIEQAVAMVYRQLLERRVGKGGIPGYEGECLKSRNGMAQEAGYRTSNGELNKTDDEECRPWPRPR